MVWRRCRLARDRWASTICALIADEALQGRRNMIAGANRNDYHLRNVTPGQDFSPEYLDMRQVVAGRYLRQLRWPARSW